MTARFTMCSICLVSPIIDYLRQYGSSKCHIQIHLHLPLQSLYKVVVIQLFITCDAYVTQHCTVGQNMDKPSLSEKKASISSCLFTKFFYGFHIPTFFFYFLHRNLEFIRLSRLAFTLLQKWVAEL